ncbi:MAG: hypothetical protein V3U67_06915 [Gemmatimonadota bacterium]
MVSHESEPPNPRGWIRRFVGAPPQLDDMVALYESLGMEVRLEPAQETDLADQCAGCALALSAFQVIYTRNPRVKT